MRIEHWEVVLQCYPDSVRRFKVPGGWLYQVQKFESEEPNTHVATRTYVDGWHPPVFVPEAV